MFFFHHVKRIKHEMMCPGVILPGGRAENSLGMAFLKFFRESKGARLTAMSAFSGKGQSRIAANYDNFWTRTRCTEANYAVLFLDKAKRCMLAILKRKGAYLPF